MRQRIEMIIDMRYEKNDCMQVTVHGGEKPSLAIHGSNCPVTIELTPNQAFQLMVVLKSAMNNIPLT